MQGAEIQTRKQAERRDIKKNIPGKRVSSFLFVLIFACMLIASGSSSWAQKPDKKAKKAQPPKESIITAVNDATVQDYLKKAEEQARKGELEHALPMLLKIHDYSEDVLKTVKLFQAQYEKVLNDASISQSEKEDIFIKLKRMGQLVPKYAAIREVSAYDLGYVYAKKGEGERARRYLLKVYETTPFSMKQDSLWMKSKRLLLALYSLEGEF
jgi:hypothetical protein